MTRLATAFLSAAILASPAMATQKAATQNVSAKRHPNLNAAQRMIDNAYDKITAAQKANEFDMAGHAAKAKTLLEQANAEIKLAAEEANENGKK